MRHRVTIVALQPLDLSKNPDSAHWRYSIPELLNSQPKEASAIRILPESSVSYAFRELKLEPGQPLKPDQVRKLGEVMEVQRVIWGGTQGV